MEEMRRRKFLKNAGIFLAVSLISPSLSFASVNDYKTKDFSGDSEKTLLARMIFGEARNLLNDEDYLEPVMIGFTAVNRAEKKIKGNSLREVILAPEQYSCFNKSDINLERLKNPEKYDPVSWKKCLTVSRRILEKGEELKHLNYEQTHYHVREMEKYPKWAKNPKMKKVWVPDYFSHFFYKEIIF